MGQEGARAFGYVRLSKDDGSGTSPEKQRDIIERTCEQRGWELVRIFEDLNVSGAKDSRPEFDEMLARLHEIRGGSLVFWKLDRIARSVPRVYDVVKLCNDNEVAFVSCAESFDTSTSAGRMMMGNLAVFAAFEREQTSDRVKGMHVYLKSVGRSAGKTPYGLRRNAETKALERDDEKWPTVLSMAALFTAGKSYRQIAKELKFGGGNLTGSSVRAILNNPKIWAALSEAQSARLQDELRRRTDGYQPVGDDVRTRSLLAGIAVCDVCDGPMRFALVEKGRQRVYKCYKGCTYVKAESLDQEVETVLLATAPLVRETPDRPKESVSDLEAKLAKVEDNFFVHDRISEARYLKLREGIMEKMAAVKGATEAIARRIEVTRQDWEQMEQAARRAYVSSVVERVMVARFGSTPKESPLNPKVSIKESRSKFDSRRVLVVFR